MSDAEDRDWQRLDKWLWCARFLRQRAECARLAEGGLLRINRQSNDKPHARVRVGDVLTLALHGRVQVVEVLALAARRGPPATAQGLYRAVPEPAGDDAAAHHDPCGSVRSAAYQPP
jgi:ribosome-associated heat shock protein Hsp15